MSMKYTKSPIYQYTVYTTATYGNIIGKRLNICSHSQTKGSANLEGIGKALILTWLKYHITGMLKSWTPGSLVQTSADTCQSVLGKLKQEEEPSLYRDW